MREPLVALLGFVVVIAGVTTAVPAVAGAEDPVQQAVSMSTDYDGMSPSQEIHVVLTIEPTETTLTDVVLRFQSGPETLIQSNSYASTVTPSNRDVAVQSDSPNQFVIPELEPGEKVEIAFNVVPSTLAQAELTPATASIELTRNGQRLDATISEPVTLTDNPWDRAEATGRPKSVGLAGAGVGGGVLAAAAIVVLVRSKRKSRESRLQKKLHNQADSLKRAGNGTVERRVERLIETVESELTTVETDATTRSKMTALTSLIGRYLPLGSDTDGSSGPDLRGADSSEKDSSGPNL